MNYGLDGKVALVTGAARGIGRAAAQTFARDGAKVVVADLQVEGGEETAQLIREAGGDAIFVKTNVADAGDVEALVHAAVDRYGRLDCAFNNAGLEGQGGPTAECTEENWDTIMAVNLKGVWLCMKYELRQMLKQGRGVIVNTASAAGLVAWQDYAAYTASKHGVVGLTRCAAVEYADKGIRINAVCPGTIDTAMVQRLTGGDPEKRKLFDQSHPMGRMGKPEEIAEAVAWLCSDAASFVTGHAMSVDGGLVAR
ncbi:MAG: SDR family oxidoreductase [Ardenticatenaceae bacterium]|nr:SDR family oxidoreductase [Ardenticatenaceae bacterium]HBY97662.1 short chain dehydrogenase [Chloroflexota bacterium]